MELQNGYTVIYNAPDRVTEEKPGPIYASKGIPSAEDAMLISYDNGEEYVDLRTFKLIYSDGDHLFGSVNGHTNEDDVNIVLKAGDEIVFGEVIIPEEVDPAPIPEPIEDAKTEEPIKEA